MKEARCQWLTPIILAIQEAEIRRMQFEASPNISERPYLKKKKKMKES
jgi:hypothetical protein